MDTEPQNNYRPQQNNNKTALAIPIAIVIAGAMIAGAVFLTNNNNGAALGIGNTNTGSKKISLAPVTDKDHILGNPNAKVVVVEFSDTECPFCKTFHQTMQQIMTDYGKNGDVAWVYRHFPLDPIHPKARKEAEATECAAEQGGNDMFWKYIDKIFAVTPSNNNLDPAVLTSTAKDLGLDVPAFTTCLNSGKYAGKIQSNYQDGIAAGVQGTPHSIILVKGTDSPLPLEGAQPYGVIKTTIDTLLSSVK